MTNIETMEWIAFMEKMHQCLSPEDCQKIQQLAAERDRYKQDYLEALEENVRAHCGNGDGTYIHMFRDDYECIFRKLVQEGRMMAVDKARYRFIRDMVVAGMMKANK